MGAHADAAFFLFWPENSPGYHAFRGEGGYFLCISGHFHPRRRWVAFFSFENRLIMW